MFRFSSFVAENKEKNFTKPPKLFTLIARYDTDYAGTAKQDFVFEYILNTLIYVFYFEIILMDNNQILYEARINLRFKISGHFRCVFR